MPIRKKENNIGIYKFTNTVNQRVYIGSSINLYQRKKEHIRHLNRGSHHSPYFQNAWDKYSSDKFEYSIIEYITDINQLLVREQHYLDTIEPWDPKIGYNICRIAGYGNQLNRFKYGQITLKNVLTNKIETELDIRQFSIKHNITIESIRTLLNNPQLKVMSNFSLPKTELVYRQIKDPNNVIHNFYELKSYCIYLGIIDDRFYKGLARVVRGDTKEFKGWCLPNNTKKQPYKLQYRSDKIIEFYNIDKFARDNNLINVTVRNILVGKSKEFSGWALPKV